MVGIPWSCELSPQACAVNLHLLLEGRVSVLLTFHVFMAYGECGLFVV